MKKIIVSICIIGLMMVSSGISANDFDMGELPMELMVRGNTLITEFGGNQTRQDGRVIEVDSAGNIVWEKTGLTEPMDAERLSNGNTVIAEFGGDRVIEIDVAGSIVWEKTGLSSPFDVERLSNGNTLIVEANVVDGHVIEIGSTGEVWNKTGLSGPVDAERLSNGNTLITEHIGKKIIEVDSAGNEVWNMTELHVPKDAERLSDGNTLIAECGANRVIEVDSTGTIEWIVTELHYPVDVERLSNPPDAPEITGETNGKKGTEYEYSFTSTDPDGDDIAKYIVNWGDGTGDETITGPFASGAPATGRHTWTEKDDYIIKAKAIDIHDAASDWGTLEVTMPKNKPFLFNFPLLSWLFEQFPYAFPLLRYLLGL